MPPFANIECVHCKKPNRFDLAELRNEDGSLVKGVVYRGKEKGEEEFAVACQHCGRKFKFTVKGRDDGKK